MRWWGLWIVVMLTATVGVTAPTQCRFLFSTEIRTVADKYFEPNRDLFLRNELKSLGFLAYPGVRRLVDQILVPQAVEKNDPRAFPRSREELRAQVAFDAIREAETNTVGMNSRERGNWIGLAKGQAIERIRKILDEANAGADSDGTFVAAVDLLVRMGQAQPDISPLSLDEMRRLIGIIEGGLRRAWELDYWHSRRNALHELASRKRPRR